MQEICREICCNRTKMYAQLKTLDEIYNGEREPRKKLDLLLTEFQRAGIENNPLLGYRLENPKNEDEYSGALSALEVYYKNFKKADEMLNSTQDQTPD